MTGNGAADSFVDVYGVDVACHGGAPGNDVGIVLSVKFQSSITGRNSMDFNNFFRRTKADGSENGKDKVEADHL